MSDVVTVTNRDSVAVITLQSPPVNGLGFAVRSGLQAALDLAGVEAIGNAGQPDLVLSHVREAGIEAPLQIEGSRVVPIVRGSTKGGDLAFIFNFERSEAKVTVRPKQAPSAVRDLLAQSDLPLDGGTFQLTIPPWKHAVVHLA